VWSETDGQIKIGAFPNSHAADRSVVIFEVEVVDDELARGVGGGRVHIEPRLADAHVFGRPPRDIAGEARVFYECFATRLDAVSQVNATRQRGLAAFTGASGVEVGYRWLSATGSGVCSGGEQLALVH
jgi:hypothetical protein